MELVDERGQLRKPVMKKTHDVIAVVHFLGDDEKLHGFGRQSYYHFVRPHGALKFGREIRTPAMQAGLATKRPAFRDNFSATTVPLWSRVEVFLFTEARNSISHNMVPLSAAA